MWGSTVFGCVCWLAVGPIAAHKPIASNWKCTQTGKYTDIQIYISIYVCIYMCIWSYKHEIDTSKVYQGGRAANLSRYFGKASKPIIRTHTVTHTDRHIHSQTPLTLGSKSLLTISNVLRVLFLYIS